MTARPSRFTLKDMRAKYLLGAFLLTALELTTLSSFTFADSGSDSNQYLPPLVVQKEEMKIAAKNDDMAPIVLQVKNDYHGPLTPGQLHSFDQYVASREAIRDSIRKYIPNIDFSHPNQDHPEIAQAAQQHPDLYQKMMVFGRESARNLEAIQQNPKTGDPFLSAIIKADGYGKAFIKSFAPGGAYSSVAPTPADYLLQGRIASSSGDNKAALKDAKAATKMDPQNASAQTLLAQAAFQTGNYPEAASAAQEVLQNHPKDKTALAIYGLSQGRNPRVDESLPSNAAPSSSVLFQSNSYSGAQSASSKASSSPSLASALPSSVPLDANLAFHMGNYRDALAGADEALKANPSDLAANLLAAQAYAGMGDYGNALSRVNAGLKVSPRNTQLLNLRSQYLSRQGRYRKALAASNVALEGNPQNAEGYYSRAMALAGVGDRNGVIDSLKRAAELDLKYQKLAEKAANLPANSDLRLLFNSPGKKGHSKLSLLALSWIPELNTRGKMILGIILLSLSGFMFLGGKKTLTRAKPEMPLPESEGKTRILSANRIAGQYQITRRIGSGGMGLVYEGADVNLGRKVAIKHLREDLAGNPQEKARFLSEARLVASLDHPNILRIYSIAEEKEEVYLVFEFIEGKTLEEWTQRRKLSLPQVFQVFKPVAQALDYAHSKGIIHRDMKPSNIMIGNNGVVHVMDFGVAREAKDPSMTSQMTRTIVGTPAYMAPETQDGFVSRESDIYGLAVCVYESLSGQLPFTATPSGTVNKIKRVYPPISSFGLPQGLDPVFNRAFDPNPNSRFKSAREFMSELEKTAGVAA